MVESIWFVLVLVLLAVVSVALVFDDCAAK